MQVENVTLMLALLSLVLGIVTAVERRIDGQ